MFVPVRMDLLYIENAEGQLPSIDEDAAREFVYQLLGVRGMLGTSSKTAPKST